MTRVHSDAKGVSVPTETVTATVADILTAAADLIQPEGAWTQGAFARTAKGHVIGSNETPAMCFCAVGAVYRAACKHGASKANRALEFLTGAVGQWHIGEWNDAPERKQSEVVTALRKAAAKAAEASA